MNKEKLNVGYFTKVALFLSEKVFKNAKVLPQSPSEGMNIVTILWEGQTIVVTRYVNDESSKPHFVYKLRTIKGTSLYSVPMSNEIEIDALHMRLNSQFKNLIKESNYAFSKLENLELDKFLQLEMEMTKSL